MPHYAGETFRPYRKWGPSSAGQLLMVVLLCERRFLKAPSPATQPSACLESTPTAP